MKAKLDSLLKEFDRKAASAASEEDVERIRIHFLGRKGGVLNEVLRGLKELSAAEKKSLGARANEVRQIVEQRLRELTQQFSHAIEGTDLSLPGLRPQQGHLHPVTLVFNELMDVFRGMGFMVYEGPEMEHDFYNFEALNFPPGHPARDIQDTFFVKSKVKRKNEKRDLPENGWLMRTHTSPMQVRLMEQFEPPLRAVVPGRAFRNEATDASHEHTFTQLEGLVVDKNVSVAQLVWTLREIFRQYYKSDVDVRLRPGFFPFVEPGFEVDMSCAFCTRDGSSCSVCKGTGWVEMGGSGMVHPNVFAAVGYPAGEYTGFAFGMGPGRLAMLKYSIQDYRAYAENDFRFLEQF